VSAWLLIFYFAVSEIDVLWKATATDALFIITHSCYIQSVIYARTVFTLSRSLSLPSLAVMEVRVRKIPDEGSIAYEPLDLSNVSPSVDTITYDITNYGQAPLIFGQPYEITVEISNIRNAVKATVTKDSLCPCTVFRSMLCLSTRCSIV